MISHRHDPPRPTAARCGPSDHAAYTNFLTDPRHDADEDNEWAKLMITAVGGGYDGLTGMHIVDIDDDYANNDAGRTLRADYNQMPGLPLRTREGDIRWQGGNQISTRSIYAELNMPPVCRGTVTVTATSSDPGAVLLATRRRAPDSELAQTVSKTIHYSESAKFYVVALDDVDADDETVTITFTTSGDYPTLTATATVTVEDDD